MVVFMDKREGHKQYDADSPLHSSYYNNQPIAQFFSYHLYWDCLKYIVVDHFSCLLLFYFVWRRMEIYGNSLFLLRFCDEIVLFFIISSSSVRLTKRLHHCRYSRFKPCNRRGFNFFGLEGQRTERQSAPRYSPRVKDYKKVKLPGQI